MNANFGLSDLDIGPFIAKGCDAVVYAAALKDPNPQQRTDSPDMQPMESPPPQTHRAEIMSPIQNTSRFVHNFGGSVDNVHYNTTSIDLDLLSSPQRYHMATGDEFRRQSISQRRQRFDSINETDNDRVADTISAATPPSDINKDSKVSIYLNLAFITLTLTWKRQKTNKNCGEVFKERDKNPYYQKYAHDNGICSIV